jgi:p-aminobenzoyl-glutamate transporter AbgT
MNKMKRSIEFMKKDYNISRSFVRSYWLILCIVLLIGFIAWHFIERSQHEKLLKQTINSQSKENPKSSTGIPPDSLHH